MPSFIDTATITVKAGDGGDGNVSFRHLKYMPKGGPDGGDGGNGGSVYLKTNANLNTLYQFRYKKIFKAGDGERGGKADKHGLDGQDLIIEVPVGTQGYYETAKGERVTFELLTNDQSYLLVKGGRGGKGNAKFASPREQAPRISTPGIKIAPIELMLELKLLADVGLVGLPNAGKSTLLSLMTSAKPEIANYPFTTLEPNLGIATYDEQSFVVADIPGLIEGASQGKGLGDTFLRHIERTSVLIHLVALDDLEEQWRSRFEIIREELAAFNEDLIRKPFFIILSKSDLVSEDVVKQAMEQFEDLEVPILLLSSSSAELISAVKAKCLEYVVRHRQQVIEEQELTDTAEVIKEYNLSNLRHIFKQRSVG